MQNESEFLTLKSVEKLEQMQNTILSMHIQRWNFYINDSWAEAWRMAQM